MDYQWWLDTAGKLGPLFVALAVFSANRAQTRWSNGLAVRAAAVEDQKFALALLERRSVALEKVSEAMDRCWTEGNASKEAVEAAGEALAVADLVYDDGERSTINDLVKMLFQWQNMNRRLEALRDSARRSDDTKYQALAQELSSFESGVYDTFNPLLAKLKGATRIKAVAPLQAPPTLWQALRAKLPF